MDFLDKLVLPQSLEHITLLHFITVIVLMLFVPFISMVFGGAFISLYYNRKGKSSKSETHKRFAKDVIDLVTVNKSTGVVLGILPVFVLLLGFSQIYHLLDYAPVKFLFFAFVAILSA